MSESPLEMRLERLENLFASAGDMMLKTVEVCRQNAQQIERNSQQIEHNARQLAQLENAMAQLALQAAADRASFEALRTTTQAALEKIDRVLDYLMQRDS